METNPPQFSDLYRSVVRIAASSDQDSAGQRIASGFFISPRTLLTTWEQIEGRTDLLVLRGRGFRGPRFAEVLSSRPQSNLACLGLDDGEPDSEYFLPLAAAFPTRPVLVRLFGYTQNEEERGWTCKSWKGRSQSDPYICDCRKRRCRYRREDRGWSVLTMRMPNCAGGWGGGPIVDAQTKEVISLAGAAIDAGESWQERAFLLGVNLTRMHDILSASSATS